MNIATLLKIFTIASLTFSYGMANAAARASRDWHTYPAVVQVDTNEDVFAIGDAHGDPQRLGAVLVAAKLIAAAPNVPEQVKWSARKSVLVVHRRLDRQRG